MDQLNKIVAPANEKLRQLQKMVQDIKKNDDSIFNRLKRFQNEQAAVIRKTGRSTLDRMTNKAPPRLPNRDYRGDNGDGDTCSDIDSDTYEDPQGENDDSYEPPPCERLFTPTSSMSMQREEYADRCSRRLSPAPRTALKPPRPRAPIPPSRARSEEEDEDYVKPEVESDDDYVEPSENTECTAVSRASEPMRSSCVANSGTFTDVYEVPDIDDHFLSSRRPSQLQLPPQRTPPIPSPRLHTRTPAPPPKPEPDDSDEEYEICDGVENVSVKSEEKPAPTPPLPLPRETRRNVPERPKRSIPAREHEATSYRRPGQPEQRSLSPRRPRPPEPRSLSPRRPGPPEPRPLSPRRSGPPEPRPLSPRRGFHRARFSLSQAVAENGHRESEEKAGVYKKPWYTSTCDRKMAEEALLRSNRDGAYLVRKSSGQDAKQPFTLVVLYNGRVYNIPIRSMPSSQRWALGREKSGEEHFSSVSHIIKNHQRNPLVLIDSQNNTKDSTKLLHPTQV
ncbi:B-cell linker protein isoform X2 [Clupea harengus]|uniref:B-cell linker protein isoform X2 n=1 Tax=Clupea harengus TaxID=7950 RepID=A0A8M1KSD8_CLUHA|nr:B-cell linker protein isoform X2 [Clupea harengus]